MSDPRKQRAIELYTQLGRATDLVARLNETSGFFERADLQAEYRRALAEAWHTAQALLDLIGEIIEEWQADGV